MKRITETVNKLNILGSLPKKNTEETRRQDIIKQQREIEKTEKPQIWKFVFGIHNIKDKDLALKVEVFQIQNITPRNLWMEDEFLFTQIKAAFPQESFHVAGKYCLAWTTPDSALLSRIPLDNIEQQEKAYHRIASMDKKTAIHLFFMFFPIQSDLDMFAPRIHPSSLVSYKTKTEIFNKLCDQYSAGKITLEELNGILVSGINLWKKIVYRNLPDDEKIYHEYLNIPTVDVPKVDINNAEELYVQGDIPFDVFHDLRFAERAKKRDLEALPYPRPYEIAICIVCGFENGIIKCIDCSNKICKLCVERLYGDMHTKQETNFLALHRYYCMKRPRLNVIAVQPIPPPSYLIELRVSGREAALRNLPPEEIKTKEKLLDDEMVTDNDNDEDDDDDDDVSSEGLE